MHADIAMKSTYRYLNKHISLKNYLYNGNPVTNEMQKWEHYSENGIISNETTINHRQWDHTAHISTLHTRTKNEELKVIRQEFEFETDWKTNSQSKHRLSVFGVWRHQCSHTLNRTISHVMSNNLYSF